MFNKNHTLMPALLTALLALAGAAVAQEKTAIDDLQENTPDPAVFAPVVFSATDDHSTFVVDTCIENHGAANPTLGLTPEILNAPDFGGWEIAREGEVVVVGGFTAEAPPTAVDFSSSSAFRSIGDPCCMCGTSGTDPAGCQAFGKTCCCKAEISLKLDEMTCYCQGGKDCTNMVTNSRMDSHGVHGIGAAAA